MSQEEHRYPVIAGLIRDIEPLPKGGEWVKKLWDRLLQLNSEEHRDPVIAGLIRDIEPLPKGGEWVKKLWDRLLQLNKERGALHETPTVSLLPGSAIKP